jgi:hypothetical protein
MFSLRANIVEIVRRKPRVVKREWRNGAQIFADERRSPLLCLPVSVVRFKKLQSIDRAVTRDEGSFLPLLCANRIRKPGRVLFS